MTTYTPNQGLELPDDPDLNNVPADMAAYNTGVENRLVQRYASAVDRSVRNPTPNKGEMSYLIDTDLHERFDGGQWRNARGGIDHFFLPGEQGTVLATFANQSSHVMTVTFATPFSLTPMVFTNIATGAGSSASWTVRAYNISTSGFNIWLESAINATSSWTNVPVNWVAVGQQ